MSPPAGEDDTATGTAAISIGGGGASTFGAALTAAGIGATGREGSAGPGRFPNIQRRPLPNHSTHPCPCVSSGSGLAPRQAGDERLKEVAARTARADAAGDLAGELAEALGDFARRLNLGDHLAVVARRSEQLRLEREAR